MRAFKLFGKGNLEQEVDAPTFIEFGAGRAKLSLALCSELPGSRVLLIERAGGISAKADSKLREVRPSFFASQRKQTVTGMEGHGYFSFDS